MTGIRRKMAVNRVCMLYWPFFAVVVSVIC